MTLLPRIAVIIPTLATRERAPFLMHAIDSVLGQQGVAAYPLVVVNGSGIDTDLLREVEGRNDVRLTRLPQTSLPLALRTGRDLVDTPWFAELDDDDELLPTALAARLQCLQADDSVDAVVSNGIERDGKEAEVSIPDVARVQANPLASLLVRNWLLPGSLLLRTERVAPAIFADIPQYLEWTWLGVHLAMRCRLAFLGEPGFIHHRDRSFSTDRSRDAVLNRPRALERLCALELPPDIADAVAGKLARAYHAESAQHLGDGNLRAAWRAHLRSLSLRDGWIYWSYTRHLLFGALR